MTARARVRLAWRVPSSRRPSPSPHRCSPRRLVRVPRRPRLRHRRTGDARTDAGRSRGRDADGADAHAAAARSRLRRVARRAARRRPRRRHPAGDDRRGVRDHRRAAGRPRARPQPGRVHADARAVRRSPPDAGAAAPRPRPRQARTAAPRPRRARAQGAEVDPGVGVGARVELRPVRRRAPDGAGAGDARLRRPPRRAVPRRAAQRPAHPRPRRHRARAPEGLVGRRDGPAAVPAFELPEVRAGLRRRRPPRHLDVAARRAGVDRQLHGLERLGATASRGGAG